MAAEVKKCTCKHENQDKIHGNGNRVHNKLKTKAGTAGSAWRCTVCGTVK